MKRTVIALACLTMALASARTGRGSRANELPRFTVDDEMAIRTIVDARIAPDGNDVTYVVSTPSVTKNEHEAALFITSTASGAPRRLGETLRIVNMPVPRPQLRWTADGSSVSVLALAGERPQVFMVPRGGGEPRAVTDAPEGVIAYEWAPDGASLAYTTPDAMPEEEARQRRDRSFVIHADAPDRPVRLVVQAIGGARRTLTPASDYVDAFTWSPDGQRIVYSAAPRAGFTAPYEMRLFSTAASGGEPRPLVDRPGMNVMPQYSPDGRWIAFVSTNGRREIMAPRSLAVVAAAGGAPRTFLFDDLWVNEFVWSPDSRSIYLEGNDGPFSRDEHMFEQPILRVSVADGDVEAAVSGRRVHYSISVSGDGRRLAFRSVDERSTGDLFVRDLADGHTRQITDINPQLRDRAAARLMPISWRSFDGMRIWGLLLLPPDVRVLPADANAAAAYEVPSIDGPRLPMLVYLHGGPNGGVTYGHFPQFTHSVGQVDPYPSEAFASAGYAVFFPMPRGSAGYGEAGQRAIVNAWGEADYKDIMAGVDRLIERGVADPDRLGVMGASYGGFMSNWVVTQTGRFKAASAGASISDLADLYYFSEGSQFIVEYFGRPWENQASYTAHSPVTFAARVSTPLLIQHGERDPRVPVGGAWKFYRTLKALGKTVELDIYPRGGHVLYEPALEREQMRRNYEWFTRWIPARP